MIDRLPVHRFGYVAASHAGEHDSDVRAGDRIGQRRKRLTGDEFGQVFAEQDAGFEGHDRQPRRLVQSCNVLKVFLDKDHARITQNAEQRLDAFDDQRFKIVVEIVPVARPAESLAGLFQETLRFHRP